MAREFKYKFGNLNRLIDEKNNTCICLREVYWNCGPDDDIENKTPKLDLRKYTSGDEGEVMGKGLGFLTEEGPNILVEALLEEGYGDTKNCVSILRKREDFAPMVEYLIEGEDPDSEDYYDPRRLLDIPIREDEEDE